MRIVIDMQGAQSTGSRTRGIGRYSLSIAQAIVRNRQEHEIVLALSGLFPETIQPIRDAFDGLLPQENIRVWYAKSPVAKLDNRNDWRRECAEHIREAFITSLKPDGVIITSLIEGGSDDAVTSIHSKTPFPVAVILYDLIPYIYSDIYFLDESPKKWYLEKINHKRQADLWLSISESSRREGIEYLGLPESRVFNISTDADPNFKPTQVSPEREQELRTHYGLKNPFILYTGGIDHRKNIEGLIRAFARLPEELRLQHQLAIVCSIKDEDKIRLNKLLAEQNIGLDEVVLTGFVPEDDLVAFYNLCKLFVFPSWHEGFGLPALEALRCNAPVIASNTSSLPEVIGWEGALFDPRSDTAIASAIERGLTDESYREELISRGSEQSLKFSWDISAERTITAFEELHKGRNIEENVLLEADSRPRLAFISPLPPARSGIADYSAMLLPELSRYYDIELISSDEGFYQKGKHTWSLCSLENFLSKSNEYDRVLYHFGNSDFHQHMFELLDAVPGVVVLHDFYLSGVISYLENYQIKPNMWVQALYDSHGYEAVNERFCSGSREEVVYKYPCSAGVHQQAIGILTHSHFSKQLAAEWYGVQNFDDWAVVPLLREKNEIDKRAQARAKLGFSEDDFVVCSFGLLAPTKLNHRLLSAWQKSQLNQMKNCRLVFAGEVDGGQYGSKLLNDLKSNECLSERATITGWLDSDTYDLYLAAADVAVQLRGISRGETSAAVLDAMNHGAATIVNANGSMAELDQTAVWMLPDKFTDEALIDALETLYDNPKLRDEFARRAQSLILERHSPSFCAEKYFQAIEGFYQKSQISGVSGVISKLSKVEGKPKNEAELISIAVAIDATIRPRIWTRRLLIDISEVKSLRNLTTKERGYLSSLKELLHSPPKQIRVEPVYKEKGSEVFFYARKFTLQLLGCPDDTLSDEPVWKQNEDITIKFGSELTQYLNTSM